MKRIRNTGDFLRTSNAPFSSLIVVPVLHFGVREGPVPKEHKLYLYWFMIVFLLLLLSGGEIH